MVTNQNGIIGTFVFRNEGDGCLSSKYMNEHERIPYTETCVLQNRDMTHQGFIGEYFSTWFEQIGQRGQGNLSIELNDGNNSAHAQTFFLSWTIDGTPIFSGIGMTFGEFMVGSYWGVNALR